jgi:hypothetical protein
MAHLSEDLVAIRDSKGLTSADIIQKTRIPANVIREIENGTLFNQPENQRTYVRSFVRNYAKAIRIDDVHIVAALDDFYSESGYHGSLREAYLGGAEAGDAAPTEESQKRVIVTSTLGATEEFTRPDPSRKHNQTTPIPPDLTEINWSGIRPSGFTIPVRMIVVGAGSMLVIALLVTAVWTKGFGLFAGGDDPIVEQVIPETPPPVMPVVPDSSQVGVPGDSTAVNMVQSPLPETLSILIYAAYDRLEPVRVQTDFSTDVYPYWIERGTAMRFEFKDQISIRGAFPRFVILFNGHVVPDKESFLVGGNTITLRRSYFDAQPVFRTAAPDSLPGLPAPIRIVQRPIFRP